jgi:SAM-dependent methyltransferase
MIPPAIDWIERWRLIVEARLAQMRRFNLEGGERSSGHWDGLAQRFARTAEQPAEGQDVLIDAIRRRLEPAWTLVDVGAGAGRYAIRLAPHVRHLVAVEPSEGMREAFQRQIERRGLANISVVATRWEDADVEPADAVLCVNVVYWTADIVPFLEKLRSHARQRCLIMLRATQSEGWLEPLWQELHGEPMAPQPSFLDLYNLLFQLGARPQAELYPTPGHQTFESLDEAVERACRDVAAAPGAVDRVRTYVESRLVQRNGKWVGREPTWLGLADIPTSAPN